MSKRYPGRKNTQRAPKKLTSDGDDSNDNDGEDLLKIFKAFHERMEKKTINKQKHLSAECDKTIQHVSQLANELILRQKKEM
ncbi:8719_t:CDS:2 [Funneliformis caledonium]|uniref:8719_t:CDS:1 n=1 Tax=Funneliformis caledonium TaxID=1117310 RepID=A0A9N8VP70_9GLOM|nr:8719_t:CDS:2 [Funneliformis caledonium]